MYVSEPVEQTADEKQQANDQIWEDIRYWDSQEEMYAGMIDDCRAKISALADLKEALARVSADFESRQQYRNEAVSEINNMEHITKTARAFAQGMKEYLNGSQYGLVCEKLKSAAGNIDSKTGQLHEEIRSYESEINRIEEVKMDLYRSLQ